MVESLNHFNHFKQTVVPHTTPIIYSWYFFLPVLSRHCFNSLFPSELWHYDAMSKWNSFMFCVIILFLFFPILMILPVRDTVMAFSEMYLKLVQYDLIRRYFWKYFSVLSSKSSSDYFVWNFGELLTRWNSLSHKITFIAPFISHEFLILSQHFIF